VNAPHSLFGLCAEIDTDTSLDVLDRGIGRRPLWWPAPTARVRLEVTECHAYGQRKHGRLFGFRRTYTAAPTLAIDKVEDIQQDFRSATDFLESWLQKRGSKAIGVELTIVASPDFYGAIREELNRFLDQPPIQRLAKSMPVAVALMDPDAEVHDQFVVGDR